MQAVPKTREDIQDAVLDSANFFHKELDLDGSLIRIGFKKMPSHIDGYMSQQKNHDGTVYYPIYINEDKDFYESIATTAHEMVHVKQYASKKFVKNDKDINLWKGNNLNWVPYRFKPWEIQAFREEIGLFNKYITHKEYPQPGIVFKTELYFSALIPYILVLEFIVFVWIIKGYTFGR